MPPIARRGRIRRIAARGVGSGEVGCVRWHRALARATAAAAPAATPSTAATWAALETLGTRLYRWSGPLHG